jgi:bacterioferritin-associated ferredoxin
LKTEFIILISRSGMYVCVCRAVTEERVKAAIDAGAKSVAEVTGTCCAGDDCGACHQTIEDLIEERWGGVATGRRLPVVRAA